MASVAACRSHFVTANFIHSFFVVMELKTIHCIFVATLLCGKTPE